MKERNGIAVAGTVLVDRLNEIGAYPASGELTQILSVGKTVGGCVPNVSIDLARIAPALPVKAVGRIGKDDDGAFLLQKFKENGVDTEHILCGETPTSFSDVMSVVGGERTFFVYPGASAEFAFEDVSFAKLDTKMLHLGYLLLLKKVDKGDGVRILKAAKEYGIKTSVDMVSENSDRYYLVKDCLPYVDNLIINEHEAGKITDISPTEENLEEIARALKAMGVSERVVIHTPARSLLLSDEHCVTLPSLSLPDGYIKGTTGAGDAFCAGVLYGIHEDFDDLSILNFASKAAAVSLSSVGAVDGMCSREEIEQITEKFKRKTE